MTHSSERRRVLAWLGASAAFPLLATPALADERPATPRMTEGPFYPNTYPSDSDADLRHVEGRAATAVGIPLDFTGLVMDRGGRPRVGAKVEIWQCDSQGQYHHVGEWQGAGDANFQGYGTVLTDGQGRYAFRTIKPVPYPGRTPHIHFTIVEGGKRKLTSQIFIEGEPGNPRDALYRGLGRDARLVTMRLQDSAGGLEGSLDIVL